MKPLLSILVPAYNAERWIAETIQSALAQSWRRKEIIIVDDGSTDTTLSIAQRFASKTVSVVAQENQGAPAARNRAFSLSQGDYVQWLDADDLLSADKIERQMMVAEQSADKRTLISCGWGYFRYRVSKARFVPTSLWHDLDPIEWIMRKWEGNHHMQTATWLVSRELTEVAGPWDSRLMGDDDGEYFCRVLLASNGVRFVPDAKVFYRITDSSRWSHIGHSDKKVDAQFLSMKLQIGYLLARAKDDQARAACYNYLKTWLPAFYPDRLDIVKLAQEMAIALGGKLEIPRANWKYSWIENFFGPKVRKNTQIRYNRYKAGVLRAWDRILYFIEAPHRKVEAQR